MKKVYILIAWLCLQAQAHAQFSLQGTVRGTDLEVLAGANIALNGTMYRTITDESGQFAFHGLEEGSYTMAATFIGFESYSEEVKVDGQIHHDIILKESSHVTDEVVISAVRASQNTPTTYSVMDKAEISARNSAQDMPYILEMQPSVVVTSDAGAGVGYTGIRIRGSDLTRINVTINGIPLNDPESHAVYWVDIPDIASSVNSLQLQRGVGSSTNGAGAFGASMNIETNAFRDKPFGTIDLGGGSFQTQKASFQGGTGLIKNHWYFEGRASVIHSDGYIDRAASDLNSYFLQGGYYGKRTLIKAISFGGTEKTYQAWYGVDEPTMLNQRTFNWAGAIFHDSDSITFYNNQADNYRQNHYQLHVFQSLSPNLSITLAGHYTRGTGYYEEYCQDQMLTNYGLDSITSDLIRRRWLSNHYYGITWSVKHSTKRIEVIFGGAYNRYDPAEHFGEIIWTGNFQGLSFEYEYYRNHSSKADGNLFAKTVVSPFDNLRLYVDLQFRTISYQAGGITDDQNSLQIAEKFNFFNPKIGLSWEIKPGTLYASYSMAHREPIRDDFLDASPGETPKPEVLRNLEVGLRKNSHNWYYAINYFLMNYRHQFVLTGDINDDGAYIRKNAGKSFRSGIELSAAIMLGKFIQVEGNYTWCLSKTDYQQVNEEDEIICYSNSDISFSPRSIAGAQVNLHLLKNMEFAYLSKYVGKQYLDNTQNNDLALEAYLVHHARLSYQISGKNIPDLKMTLSVNNLLNAKYASNGYAMVQTPYYYPQAGTNFMFGLQLGFE
jgi:iron complex outermembrane receptor protein